MSGNPTGFFQNFITSPTVLSQLKEVLDILDTVDDDFLLNVAGPQASSDLIAAIYPFSNALPLDGDYLTMATSAAIFETASLYKAKKNNKDMATYYYSLYKDQREKLIGSLKANRNTRTQRVSVSSDYQTQRTYAQLRKW